MRCIKSRSYNKNTDEGLGNVMVSAGESPVEVVCILILLSSSLE